MVEEWANSAEPTALARLSQIRALLELRSVDRAWARLQPLLEQPSAPEVFHLAGQILIDRGRLGDARAMLSRGRHQFPDDDAIQSLIHKSEAPGTVIDTTSPNEDDQDGQCQLAERLLIEGSPLKARRILERIRRTHADHNRTADLLWALDGDFTLRGVTLSDLARVHATPMHALLDATEMIDDRTEAGAMPESDSEAPAFPNLFKSIPNDEEETEPPGEDTQTDLGESDEEPEVTHVSAIVTDAAANEVTQENTREDTQIMHVIRTGKTGADAASVDTLVDKSFDLKSVEQHMGGESEDENVIVHVNRPNRPVDVPKRDEGIKLDPSRERVQRGANVVDEGAEFMRPRKRRQVIVEPAPPKADKAPSAPPKKTPDDAPRTATPAASTPSVAKPAAPATTAPAPNASDMPPSEADTLPPAAQPSLPKPASNLAARAPGQRGGVALKRIPTDERPKLDPKFAAAPTEILEDADEPASAKKGIAPVMAWLMVLALFGLLVLATGTLLILYQVFTA